MKNTLQLWQLLFSLAIVVCQAKAQEVDWPPYLPPGLGSARIWFVPGWRHGKTPAGYYQTQLKDVFNEAAFVFSWNASGSWRETTKLEIPKAAKRLSYSIAVYPEKQRREMILIGHSLGARVIIEASRELIEKNVKLKRVILVGGAVAFDEPCLKDVEQISIEPPINIFNRSDGVLKHEFSPREGTFACGHIGIQGGQTSFRQFEVSREEKEKAATTRERETFKNHSLERYLKTLKQVLSGQLVECKPPDLAEINRILTEIGLEKKPKIPTLQPSEVPIVDTLENWELRQFTIGGVCFYFVYDPCQRLVFTGDCKEVESIWGKLKERLEKVP